MYDVKDALLPPTATPLAQALDILEERLFGLPVQMISKDPWAVDVSLLDHLAWEHSVDVWDAGWEPEIKRKVISASREVHRFKGTRYAIEKALEAIGLNGRLIEWWEPDGTGERGSFQVRADIAKNQAFFQPDSNLLSLLTQMVRSSAPVSRKFEIVFRAAPLAREYGGCISVFSGRVSNRAGIPDAPIAAAAFNSGALSRASGHLKSPYLGAPL